MSIAWFDKQLDIELENLLKGKSSLNSFKCFLMPNSHYLDLPADHKAYTIKLILAEQYTPPNNLTDEEMIRHLKREFLPPHL